MFRETWWDFIRPEAAQTRGSIIVGIDRQHWMRDSQAVAEIMRLFPRDAPHLPSYHGDARLWQLNLQAESEHLPPLPLLVLGRPAQYCNLELRQAFDGIENGWCRRERSTGTPFCGRFHFDSDSRQSPGYSILLDELDPEFRRPAVGEGDMQGPRVDYGVVFRAVQHGQTLMAMFGSHSLGTYGCAAFAADPRSVDTLPPPPGDLASLRQIAPLEIVIRTTAVVPEYGYSLAAPSLRVVRARWGPWLLDVKPGQQAVWEDATQQVRRARYRLTVPDGCGAHPAGLVILLDTQLPPAEQRLLELPVDGSAGQFVQALALGACERHGPQTYEDIAGRLRLRQGGDWTKPVRDGYAYLRRHFLEREDLEWLVVRDERDGHARFGLSPEVVVEITASPS